MSMIIEIIPKSESFNFTCDIPSIRCSIASIKSFDLPLIPNKPFICVEAICRAAAVVNPAVTGTDINSIKNPIIIKIIIK